MQHSDPDDLVLIALGDAPPSVGSEHLNECSRCAQDLADLARVVDAGRAPEQQGLVEPPPDVWSGIRAELNLDSVDNAEEVSAPPSPEGRRAVDSPEARGVMHALWTEFEGPDSRPSAANKPRTKRGRRRTAFGVAAAAALLGAAAGSGITWWVVDQDAQPAVAGNSRALTPLVPSALGSARVGDISGQRKLDIKVEGLPKTSGYFEVWLMDRSHTKLISMGVLGPEGHAVLPVPDNLDLKDYPYVDVSDQAYNGSPEHSGRSIVRGQFAGGQGKV
ncbi:anti-sigma factor [Streptomyces parvus]|uniref:Anti-sigma factor n=1 Tax=Streptomyces parvus TaxID=66428 RepID=A0A5D4JMD2_9ACTN|nr:anti-sigma factor [Streptomyces parvus]TYR66094.1 anti-sigma factor [Streptomyces parvus]